MELFKELKKKVQNKQGGLNKLAGGRGSLKINSVNNQHSALQFHKNLSWLNNCYLYKNCSVC